MKPALGTVVAIAIATAALAACTSSGGAPATDSGSATQSASTGTSAASGPSPTDTPAGPTGAPTSVPVVVPTGTKAPFPTPGKEPSKQPNQTKVLNALPGSSAASCAVVHNQRDLRAGSVGAGNFQNMHADFKSSYGKTEVPELNMYLIPQHAKHMRKVTATVDPFGSGQTRTVKSTSVEDAEASRYYALQLPVAKPGKYRLTFAAGQDHGCFVVSFHA
jgi:hypothetical protein